MKRNNRQSGQSLVEFALLATLLITLLLGIFDFGRAYYTQVAIKNAIGDAGYYAIQHPDDTTGAGVKAVIIRQLSNLSPAIQDSNITISSTCTSSVGRTKIRVSYSYSLIFTWIIPSATVQLGDETYVPQLKACS